MHRDPERTRSYAACLLAALFFGASMPASKALLGSVDPLVLASLVYLGAALAALPRALRDPRPRIDRRNERRLAGAILAGGVLAPGLQFLGLSMAPASSVALWSSLEPIATAALAILVFREHGGTRTWTAVALATAAAAGLASPSGFGLGLAALLVAAACVLWGLDNNLSATIDATTPSQTTVLKGAAGAAMNAAFAAVTGAAWPPLTSAALAVAVGAVGIGASLVLYLHGAQRLGATRSQLAFATFPFVGAALAWIALGERMSGLQIGCALAMAAAVGLLIASRHAHEHTHDPMKHTHSHRHDDGHHDHVHAGLSASTRHTHEHTHAALTHFHPHEPDLHHRHAHASPRVAAEVLRDGSPR